MSEEVCLYNKLGFCKYRESCRRHHYRENCEKERCQDKDICQKDTPKYAENSYRKMDVDLEASAPTNTRSHQCQLHRKKKLTSKEE